MTDGITRPIARETPCTDSAREFAAPAAGSRGQVTGLPSRSNGLVIAATLRRDANPKTGLLTSNVRCGHALRTAPLCARRGPLFPWNSEPACGAHSV